MAALSKNTTQEDVDANAWACMPDYTRVWSPAEAEEKLLGFKFNGPGWYSYLGDTILALAMPDNLFLFCIYDRRNPARAFNWIANAPLHSCG